MSRIKLFFLSFLSLAMHLLPLKEDPLGQWELLQNNTGISHMHMQLLPNDRVIMFDRTNFGKSNLSLPNGICRYNPNDRVLKVDCTAHSIEYDVLTNTFRPLMIQTDTWCSSGSLNPNGNLIQTGGSLDGANMVRVMTPCTNQSCDWVEVGWSLHVERWYATNQLLPDGTQIIIGGIQQHNYEFYPKTTYPDLYYLEFLTQTYDVNILNNLYPFVFLNVDGNLFIFSNNRAILLDYKTNTVVKNYPKIPGGDPRCYPSSASAVLLPIRNINSNNITLEFLVCGGAPFPAYFEVQRNGNFVKALTNCGRINITDPNPQWEMDNMPLPRVMGDAKLLPDGNVLIINGAASGTAGWEYGKDPVLNPVIYHPGYDLGSRFEVAVSTIIPRMYHSTAVLLRDGRVIVGGSNPHKYYNFSGVRYPTELSLEAFYPPYFDPCYDIFRPKITSPSSSSVSIGYGQSIVVECELESKLDDPSLVSVTMISPSFTTHAWSMNQRMLVLTTEKVVNVKERMYQIQVGTPPTTVLAPPGYYMLFVVYVEIPSTGIWVQIK